MSRALDQVCYPIPQRRQGGVRTDVRKLALAVGLACCVAPLSASPAPAELRQFSNWIVGCDNRAECTAIGMATASVDPVAPSVAIRIGVDRTSLSGFSFEVIRLPADSAELRPIVISCLPCAGGHGADRIDLVGRRIDVTDMRGARWLDRIGQGQTITATWPDGVPGATIDTSAFLEAWKHLAQTRGALMREALALSQPEESQRAGPAIEVMPSGSPAIEPALRRCPAAADAASFREFALPGSARLWGLTCRKGSVATLHWFQAEGSVGEPSPLLLPDADRGHLNAGDQGFAESVFDFDFGILRARSGPAGREDCGIQRAWGWTGRTWVLLERREMPACIGLEPSDWVRTYAAP